ncbi:MAG: hypothetical protein NUW22_04965 [Acidobacteria bacterium]|nr:hypothetical protein [Acidobacteriota bacterium]
MILVLFAVSVGGWFLTRAGSIADTAVVRYEEFQEIYNTCRKIDTDLATVRAVPEDDRMFAAFSKAAMVAQKKQQLSRWVEEYNAKSRMWNRALWKSDALPYQLNVNQFANFGEVK